MPPDPKFPRGARRSPQHRTMHAPRFIPILAPPAQFCVVPTHLDPWGNDRYGDCVTAEEAFKCACYPYGTFIPPEEVIRWASRHGYLNGANLAEVMESMQREGFKVAGQEYRDGPYSAVDYSNEQILQAAIWKGTVKIAIGADALPGGAGNHSGWYAVGNHGGQDTDHSVSLTGYGPAGYLYDALKVELPPALRADQSGYLLYTWATIGYVDHAWLMAACAEAWLRQPNTVGNPPLPDPVPIPPTPTPTPTPTPQPWFPCLADFFQAVLRGDNLVMAVISFVGCLWQKKAITDALYHKCMESCHRAQLAGGKGNDWKWCVGGLLVQLFTGVPLADALEQFITCITAPNV